MVGNRRKQFRIERLDSMRVVKDRNSFLPHLLHPFINLIAKWQLFCRISIMIMPEAHTQQLGFFRTKASLFTHQVNIGNRTGIRIKNCADMLRIRLLEETGRDYRSIWFGETRNFL